MLRINFFSQLTWGKAAQSCDQILLIPTNFRFIELSNNEAKHFCAYYEQNYWIPWSFNIFFEDVAVILWEVWPKNSNFPPSMIADNLEHVTFWPEEYLWITSHVLNLRFSCLYFQVRRTSPFLRIFWFYKDLFYRALPEDCCFKKILFNFIRIFAFLLWKQTWLLSANENCLSTQFHKSNIKVFEFSSVKVYSVVIPPTPRHPSWYAIFMLIVTFRYVKWFRVIYLIKVNFPLSEQTLIFILKR